MQEIDRLYFSKYSVDPENELNMSDMPADATYDDFEVTGLDEEEWPEMD
jgi:hypothetical protein